MAMGRSRIDQRWETSTLRGIPEKIFGVLFGTGVTRWGPTDVTAVTSFDDYKEKFGGFLASYDFSLHMWLYFKHGGTKAYIKRLLHYAEHGPTGTGIPATAAKGTKTLQTGAGPYGVQNTLKVDGLYYGALALRVQVLEASDGLAEHFDLTVYHPDYTQPIEHFYSLTMDSTSTSYAVDVINTSVRRSGYIFVTDLVASGTPTHRRPATLVSPVALTGGDDGLAGLVDADYVGGVTFRTGFYGFDTVVTEGNILVCPDATSVTVQNAATAYCENPLSTGKQERVIFFPDTPASLTNVSIRNQATALTNSRARIGLDWPLIRIQNPDKDVYGQNTETLSISTASIKAGMCARLGQNSPLRMWTNPSNEVEGWIEDAVGLEGLDVKHEVMDPAIQDRVTDYGVNPILVGRRGFDGRYGVWFNDCQSGEDGETAELVSIGNQCGLSHLRYTYEAYLQRHRTQGNTKIRRKIIEKGLKSNLGYWTGLGCFASQDASQAFYVNTDPEGRNLNNPVVQRQQKMKIKIGIAFADPARFIELTFTRDNRAVESFMQQVAASGGNAVL